MEKNQAVGERKSSHGGEEKGKVIEGKIRLSRCSDGRSSIVGELNIVHETRATRGVLKLEFFVEAPRGRGCLLHRFLFT